MGWRCPLGLPNASELRKRAWSIAGHPVADPVDLLSNKLETVKIEKRRDRDSAHIEILWHFCRGLSLHFYENEAGRGSIAFIQRWERTDTTISLPTLLIPGMLGRASKTNHQGRRLLMRWLCSEKDEPRIDELLASAPERELAQLIAIRDGRARDQE